MLTPALVIVLVGVGTIVGFACGVFVATDLAKDRIRKLIVWDDDL